MYGFRRKSSEEFLYSCFEYIYRLRFFQEDGADLLRYKILGENVRTGMLYLEVEYYAVERFCCKGMKYMKTMGKQ